MLVKLLNSFVMSQDLGAALRSVSMAPIQYDGWWNLDKLRSHLDDDIDALRHQALHRIDSA